MKAFLRKTILAGCTAAALSSPAVSLNERDKDYLEQKKEVVFVVQPQNAPFELIHKKQITGMNVELAQWMAADMGFIIRIETAPLNAAMEMVRNGEADVMTSFFHSNEPNRDFAFTQTLKMTPVMLYVRSDNDSIHDIYSLNYRSVALVGSGHAMSILEANEILCEVKFVSSTAACVDLVSRGEVDAMIGNELVTQHYMYSSGQSGLKVVGDPLYTARLGMAVKSGEAELLNLLNKGISFAQKSGTLNRIQAKWLGSEYARKIMPFEQLLAGVSYSIAAGVLLILLILLWNRKLQRVVAERTRQYADSEDQLRQIFENSPDAVFVLDREGHILSANERACESVKMSKKELLVRRVHDLAPAAFSPDVEANMEKWFSGELQQCEGACMTSEGELVPIEMTGSLQRMDGRTVLQLHTRDITFRKEAEEKLHAARLMAENAKRMAERASQAKSEFLANMSHEIRTPLNGIIGMTQLVADTELTSEQSNCVETIQQSTGGLLKIINHVLDISKIEAGQMDIRTSTMNLRDLCDGLFYIFQPRADQVGVELRCACAANVPDFVIGDEGLIEQVLINLIGNALKFTHEGSVNVTIESRENKAKGDELYFQVTDTGIGINENQQTTVFDKFTQADGSAKRLYGGTGLGLTICKQLVELMGGTIGLNSSSGTGSTFFFNLNLPAAPPPKSTAHHSESAKKTVGNADVKVLLVEDNLVNQKVATAILRKAGCHVDTAENGEAALENLQMQQYDIILMDCQMPIMDGFEATARIRALDEPTGSIPIIAITAHAMKNDKQKCLDCGMNDYISKPVSRQALIDLINHYTA